MIASCVSDQIRPESDPIHSPLRTYTHLGLNRMSWTADVLTISTNLFSKRKREIHRPNGTTLAHPACENSFPREVFRSENRANRGVHHARALLPVSRDSLSSHRGRPHLDRCNSCRFTDHRFNGSEQRQRICRTRPPVQGQRPNELATDFSYRPDEPVVSFTTGTLDEERRFV